ncbi:hypothetical protein niasHS_012144 [Heterodera schachtii]|uniref:Innexin n=1 Tax=Heterodera schachtii TaxID=97005 RepID=A0ABD2IJR6_HETSC
MKALIDTVLKYIGPNNIKLDDFTDRLCYRYTPVLLGLFMFITGTVDNFGSPIRCMVPQEFSASWSNFVHQYCYVTGTYVKIVDPSDQTVERIYVNYYQWVPYMLILQAMIMRLPLSFWRFGRRVSDADFDYVNELGLKARTSTAEKRTEFLTEAANYIYQIVGTRKTHNGLGSLVGYMYLFYKVINVIVVFAQIYMLKIFIGYNSWTWGISFLSQNSNSSHGNETSFVYFPRVAYCQFDRDFLGQSVAGIHQEARCTLGINMLNEKVFMFLFFWYYLLFGLVLSNAFIHSQRLLSAYRVSSVRGLLRFGTKSEGKKCQMVRTGACVDENTTTVCGSAKRRFLSFTATSTPNCRRAWTSGSSSERSNHFTGQKNDINTVSRFVDECLGQDGYLMLHFVSQNAGKLIASELTTHLFDLMTASD